MSITSDFDKLLDIKQDIYDSIIEKDGTLSNDSPFEDYSQAIRSIPDYSDKIGIEMYDSTETYSQNKVVLTVVEGVVKIYQSLVDNNTASLTDANSWRDILANTNLSNLSSTGESKIKSNVQLVNAVPVSPETGVLYCIPKSSS